MRMLIQESWKQNKFFPFCCLYGYTGYTDPAWRIPPLSIERPRLQFGSDNSRNPVPDSNIALDFSSDPISYIYIGIRINPKYSDFTVNRASVDPLPPSFKNLYIKIFRSNIDPGLFSPECMRCDVNFLTEFFFSYKNIPRLAWFKVIMQGQPVISVGKSPPPLRPPRYPSNPSLRPSITAVCSFFLNSGKRYDICLRTVYTYTEAGTGYF